MPIVNDPTIPFEYILRCDRKMEDGEKGKTIFKLLQLKPRKHAQIQDNALAFTPAVNPADTKGKVKSGSTELSVVMEGIAGWENFWVTKDGGEPEEIIFKQATLESNLAYISPTRRTELAEAIQRGSALTEEEEKNLS
jgi:hypothetical protein